MKVEDSSYSLELTTQEFRELIPENAWDIIAETLCKKASEVAGVKFKELEDIYDCTGIIKILVST